MNQCEMETPKFCISGPQSSEDIQDLDTAVQEFGGQVLKCSHLHNDCTHLLVKRLAKTEKILCALARGIPILSLRPYLDKCREVKGWILDEQRILQLDIGCDELQPKFVSIVSSENCSLRTGMANSLDVRSGTN